MQAEGGIVRQNSESEVLTKTQDGDKHYLLCRPCEQLMGRNERYLADFAKGTSVSLARIGVSVSDGRVTGLNATQVLGAIAGIALKAHHSPIHSWRDVVLTSDQLAECRSVVVGASDRSLHLYANRWVSLLPGIHPSGAQFSRMVGDADVAIIELMFAGWSWYLGWGDVPSLMPSGFDPVRSAPWRVSTADFTISLAWHRGGPGGVGLTDAEWRACAALLGKRGVGDLIPGRNDSCICGSGQKYKRCCLPRWGASIDHSAIRP